MFQKEDSVEIANSMIYRFWNRLLPPCKSYSGGGRPKKNLGGSSGGWWFFVFILYLSGDVAQGAVPRFLELYRMSHLLLSEETEVDSIIYRIRAQDADKDYPLNFKINTIGKNIIYLNIHTCTPSNNFFCEADVYLGRKIEYKRVYNFELTVIDATGAKTTVPARIDGTEGRVTPISDIFVKYNPVIRVKEDRPPESVISTMIVRKKEKSPFGVMHTLGDDSKLFKIRPGNLVSSELSNESLILDNKLDYDKSNLHFFQVCQLYPYMYKEVDTRNIACVFIAVIVEDVQDLKPTFYLAPPVTRIPPIAVKGDKILTVGAEDMDRGEPREVRYSILPASSLYAHHFKMDSKTGVLSMNESAEAIKDKMVSLDPILLTVTAEEVTRAGDTYPPLATSVEIALVILDAEILIPKFVHEKYVGEVYEDSKPDSEVFFNSSFFVHGIKGLFSLDLEGDNGAFLVYPGVAKDPYDIKIKVKNSFLLDYETNPQITFRLVARQVRGPQQVSGSAEITVKVLDTNDNKPKFSQAQYVAEVFENVTRGTSITRVYATDDDSGAFGVVRYTTIHGPLSDRLYLDETSGLVTVATDNHSFDRETASEYVLTVEARDNNGKGVNVASAKVIIRLKDVNDSPPKFEDSIYKGVLAPDLLRLREPIQVRATDNDAERPNNEIEYDLERSRYSDYFYIEKISGKLDMKQSFAPRTLALQSRYAKGRKSRALDDSDSVINLRVRATDRGYPPLSESVDVKIFKQELGERVFTFIYPRPREYIITNKAKVEAKLDEITGGNSEIKDVKPRRTGYLGTNIDPDRSEVTALVRFGIHTIVDLERVLYNINNSEVVKLQTEKIQSEKTIRKIEGKNYSYLVGVVFLCFILAIIILIVALCCICEGCPLYKDRKKYNMVGDDGSEGVSYIRVDENGKYRKNPEGENPMWWEAMPNFLRTIFLMCGYVPNERMNSRLAWSSDERHRYWKMNQAPEASVDDRPMVRPPRSLRDSLLLEDLDDGRFQRERLQQQRPGQYSRVESRASQNSQEPRRVFVLKDPRGVVPKGRESLRDGEMYLIEDVDETAPGMMKMEDGRGAGIMLHQDDDYPYGRQGNAEALRLHASSHDAAHFRNMVRRVRRAGMDSEGTVLMQEDPGGGGSISSRLIEGQSVGQTPRSNREYYVEDKRGYASPSQSDVYIQTDGDSYNSRKRIKSPIQEETKSLLDAERKSFKDKNRTKKNLRSEVQKYVERSNNDQTEQRSKSSRSVKSANIPGTYGYQHTRTSILRYESNKAKLEEDREELIRQGKDPDMCHTHIGRSTSAGERSFFTHSGSKLEGKRSRSQNTLPTDYGEMHNMSGPERRGSLPEIETTLEREAARRILVRRNSAGGYEHFEDGEYHEAPPRKEPVREQVIYVSEAERSDELERRWQQRRSEASEAISENMRPHIQNKQVVEDVRIVEGRVAELNALEIPTSTAIMQPYPTGIVPVHGSNRGNVIQPLPGVQSTVDNSGNIIYTIPGGFPPSNGTQHYVDSLGNLIHVIPNRQSIPNVSLFTSENQLDTSPSRQAGPQINQSTAQKQAEYSPNVNNIDLQKQVSNNSVVQEKVSNTDNVIHSSPSRYPVTDNNLSVETIRNPSTVTNNDNVQPLQQNSNPALNAGDSSAQVNSLASVVQKQNANPSNVPAPDIVSNSVVIIPGLENEPTQKTSTVANIMDSNQETNNNNLNIENLEANPKALLGGSNLPDDAKSANSLYMTENVEEVKRFMETEAELGIAQSSKIFEKNRRNDRSVLNIPNNRKRNKMLEKKSIFTIAYDGMKTDQLRPESAAAEP